MSELLQLLEETGYTEDQLVAQYRELADRASVLSSIIGGIRIVSLVMSGDEPISLQLPQSKPANEYDPEYIQAVRDALAYTSLSLRVAKKAE